jgi:hypothetical protein
MASFQRGASHHECPSFEQLMLSMLTEPFSAPDADEGPTIPVTIAEPR